MVDNENQWEDIEYSEGTEAGQDYSYEENEEYADQSSEQEYEDYENYEDEEDDAPVKKKSNPLPMLLIFFILLAVGGFIAISKFTGGSQTTVADNQENQQSMEVTQNSDELANSFFEGAENTDGDMSSVSFNENGDMNVGENTAENNQVATVTEPVQNENLSGNDLFDTQIASDNSTGQENNAIMVVYNKAARSNPFKPPVVKQAESNPYEVVNDTQFEIIEPPVTSVPDENLTRLLQTQISGILYDNESPSAIVNLNGMDQFVKVGDTVSGYKIVEITRDKVQISYKNNSYVASVGELFSKGSLEKRPAVANLENKFAGRYKN